MSESPDPQLQLKKRARRRLVGAVAFAGLAAVVLPMVMDEEPKRPIQDVQIRIPGQDQVPFRPKDLVDRAAPSPPAAATAAAGDKPSALASSSGEAAAALTEKPAGIAAAQPGDKTGEKASESKPARLAEKPPDKADKKGTKATEKMPEKPAEKKVSKPAEKAPEKAVEKPVAKVANKVPEKPPVKKADKPAEKPPETGADEAGKPPADDVQRSTTAPAGKPSEAAPARSGAGGPAVILIGAFANPENAKQLQGKINGAGVSTYTEILDTPDGKKTRVRAGPFPNREAAEKALDKLKKIGVSGVVAGRQ
jgi:DedD protein